MLKLLETWDHLNIHLDESELTQSWVSDIRETPAFSRLVVSWNTQTYEYTNIEVWIRVRTASGWSMWFSYGKWTTDGKNTGSFSGQKDSIAALEIDELIIQNGLGDAVQLKATLNRKTLEQTSPLLYRLYVSLFQRELTIENPAELTPVHIDVPARPQESINDKDNIICSPTSVAMVLEYYGCNQSTKSVALGARDNGTSIYGNWPYNTAYAAEQGFKAYVSYCSDFSEIMPHLLMGRPIVASVLINDPKDLDGSLLSYPNGHLLVITGIEQTPTQTYVLVNDSAARVKNEVPRRYRFEQFEAVWRNIIYLIEPLSH